MITPYNILRHELIGLYAEVSDAAHEGYKNIKGRVVDETRNTLTIETEGNEKKVPKDCVTLDITLPEGTIVRVDGKLLVARPEDRVKKKYRIRF
ncbi:MAG: ribonuclease P [Candidatus Altiarchaeales archaeon WOR_SM1_86-2]|nr:MAG: ribonuclease P [Candidatus Altiarchaeales archaeon WOR_SM1_86-2]